MVMILALLALVGVRSTITTKRAYVVIYDLGAGHIRRLAFEAYGAVERGRHQRGHPTPRWG